MTDDLSIRPALESDVREFATWRYEPPYDVYNFTEPVDQAVEYFLGIGTRVIDRAGELAAFFTFGDDAQVPGGDYSKPALDIGLGVKPSLTGRGVGRRFVRAVVDHAASLTSDSLRVTIAAGNGRARRVWSDTGFVEVQRFASPATILGTNEFVIMILPAA